MINNIQRIPDNRQQIQSLLPVERPHSGKESGGDDHPHRKSSRRSRHTGPSVEHPPLPDNISHLPDLPQRSGKNAALVVAESIVEKHSVESYRQWVGVVSGAGESTFTRGREFTGPARIVLENLYQLVTPAHEESARRTTEKAVADAYQRMAFISSAVSQLTPTAVDLYV